MEQNFKIGQLTKELVALRLKEIEDPCAVAAGLVKRTITVALKAKPEEAKAVISDACYGGMQGLLLAEQDLARGAALILQAVCDSAQDVALDPTELMRHGLHGLARFSRFESVEGLASIRYALEERFHGVGEAFSDALAAEGAAAPVKA